MIAHPFLVSTPVARYFVDDHCANCLTALPEDIAGLWCSSWCNDINAKVRYWRAVQRDGRIEDPTIIEQLQMNVAFLLIGGYRALGRRPTAQVRRTVISRDDGRCRQCGKPGTDVDHIDGNSDDPENLQLLCKTCHRAKTFAALSTGDPLTTESRTLVMALALSRVEPDEPRLLADDEVHWKDLWKQKRQEREERFVQSLRTADVGSFPKSASRATLLALRNERLAERAGDQTVDVETRPWNRSGDWWFEDLMNSQ